MTAGLWRRRLYSSHLEIRLHVRRATLALRATEAGIMETPGSASRGLDSCAATLLSRPAKYPRGNSNRPMTYVQGSTRGSWEWVPIRTEQQQQQQKQQMFGYITLNIEITRNIGRA